MTNHRNIGGPAIGGRRRTWKTPWPPRRAMGPGALRAVGEVFAHYAKRGVDFGYQGVFEDRYTDAFVRFMGVPGHADAVSSGTAALFVALAALEMPRGSHVLVSPVSDPGTVNAIIMNGFVPVLIDASPGSFNMDPESLRQRITRKAMAVMLVHLGGIPAPADLIARICRDRGLYLVEDCSQAHGAAIRERKVGTFGDIAAFSTMFSKNHSTGGCGGVVYTRSKSLHLRARAHADRGKPFGTSFDPKDPGQFQFPALNFNADEISCAIGVYSLGKLQSTIDRRLRFLRDLDRGLRASAEICRLSATSDGHSPFFKTMILDLKKLGCPKRKFTDALSAEGVPINPDYRFVLGEWKWLRPYLAGESACPNAVAYREGTFNLLFNENFGEREAGEIARAIVRVERALLRRR